MMILVMLFASAFEWIAEQTFEAEINACVEVKAGGKCCREETGTMQRGTSSDEICREQSGSPPFSVCERSMKSFLLRSMSRGAHVCI